MYCELFHLKEPPFRLTPDPQFLFGSKQHTRAKAYMESTIWLADGFVVITGDIGSGKTTLIESFLTELPDDVVLAHISQTQLSPVEFLQSLLVEFGFKPFAMRKIELLAVLKDFLVKQYAEGKRVILIVDESQNLSRKVLEEIRLLSGIEAQKEKVLRIILAGQPELADKLDSPNLRQLAQRIRLRFHLSAFSKRETREYIEHRLGVAGAGQRKVFSDEALDSVFRYTGGVPRLINILCDTAMLCAFADEKDFVELESLEAAVEELQWTAYSERHREPARELDSTDEHKKVVLPFGRLDILHEGQLVGSFDLAEGRAIIGRTSNNDLQLRSTFVSRHHAQILTDPQRSTLEDLNSTNGIFVGSQRVRRHELSNGDAIRLGEHKLVYRDLREGLVVGEASTGEQPKSERESSRQEVDKPRRRRPRRKGRGRVRKPRQ
jgi:type II secretory pathway predicted ATPase ExeA/pSer/pThr/pTyr-binding forkhead associated (FHA) protein